MLNTNETSVEDKKIQSIIAQINEMDSLELRDFFKGLDSKYRADKAIVLAAVKSCGSALVYASV